MAPLTLSGERQDGAVAADARRKPTTGLTGRASRFTSLLQLQTSKQFPVPVSKVASLSPEAQRRWADQVLEMRRRQEIFSASPKQVLTMKKSEQKLWAEHTLQEYRHRLMTKRSKKWANQVAKLMHLDKWTKKEKKDKSVAHRKEKKRLQNKVSRVVAEKEKPVSLDAFGFPELKAPFPKVQSIQTRLQISESLESHRKCDKACIQLAQSLVKNELPV